MKIAKPGFVLWSIAIFSLSVSATYAQTPIAVERQWPGLMSRVPNTHPPDYAIDLMTSEGMALLEADWRNMDARVVEAEPLDRADPQWQVAYDIEPQAGLLYFDDSAWPVIQPESLSENRGGGKVYFTWFRTTVTIPEQLDDFDPTGTVAVLHVSIDDYCEVWVDGELSRTGGKPSPGAIQGFNKPNRVLLSESVSPGDQFEIAVFGINGPISASPQNFVWFREARLEFQE